METKEHKFKPFERVLVRDFDNINWCADFFSHYENSTLKFVTTGGTQWKYCIPYEGNEDLLENEEVAEEYCE